jgi:hypothetical protein
MEKYINEMRIFISVAIIQNTIILQRKLYKLFTCVYVRARVCEREREREREKREFPQIAQKET